MTTHSYSKEEVNSKSTDELIELLDNYHYNNQVDKQLHIVSLLSGKNATELICNLDSRFYCTNVNVILFINALRTKKLLYDLKRFKFNPPTEFFLILKEYNDIYRLIKGLKKYYHTLYTMRINFSLVSKNINTTKDIMNTIESCYIQIKNNKILLERLKECILLLEKIFLVHREYYEKQKEFRISYDEISGQIEAMEHEAMFDSFVEEYCNNPRFLTSINHNVNDYKLISYGRNLIYYLNNFTFHKI